MAKPVVVGADAIKAKGWFGAHKWLILRRISQLSILGLFLLPALPGYVSEKAGGFFASVWNSLLDQWPALEGMKVIKGNLAASMALDVIPMTDPHILLQAILAGVEPHRDAIIGVIIVIGFYLLVSGRVYCSWVCPVNMVTDTASWLRRKLGIKNSARFKRSTRYWMLGMTFILPLITGSIVWELFNPVSMLFRGIVFGLGMAWVLVLGIFLFDLLISKDGWCGRLCPVGAFYSLLGTKSPLRVVAAKREQCNDCMDCFVVCPEAQVIKPALKGAAKGIGPVILSSNCTNCGRCIDVCAVDVFNFGKRSSGIEVKNISGAVRQHNLG